MATLQKRHLQKRLLERFKIPTAPFTELQGPEDFDMAHRTFNGSFVVKANFGGYDGYGTYFVNGLKSKDELRAKLWPVAPKNKETSYIAEQMVPFRRELAITFFRSVSGQFAFLPLVETKQENGRCVFVIGPAKHPKLTPLTKKFHRLMEQENYVGALSVELFDTGKDLLVNELAPRVHNSAHYSQNALSESQFLLHIKAGLDLAIANPILRTRIFAMINLLGTDQKTPEFPADLPGHFHWYGKSENRKGRKMGHINICAKNPAALKKLVAQIQKRIKK